MLLSMEQAVLFIGLGFYSLDLIACFGDGPAQASSSKGSGEMTVAVPLEWDALTFFTANLLRITSHTWLSHMLHIMPSIFKMVSVIYLCLLSRFIPFLEWKIQLRQHHGNEHQHAANQFLAGHGFMKEDGTGHCAEHALQAQKQSHDGGV